MNVTGQEVDKVFGLIEAEGCSFASACRAVGVPSRWLRRRIYRSRDGGDTALWDRYVQTLPRCDLCNDPVPDPKDRIHEGDPKCIEEYMTFCSIQCQQQWHEEE